MKTIVWKGPDRLIPPYGSVEKGVVKDLPDNVADSYIGQNLADLKGKVSKIAKSATMVGDDNG